MARFNINIIQTKPSVPQFIVQKDFFTVSRGVSTVVNVTANDVINADSYTIVIVSAPSNGTVDVQNNVVTYTSTSLTETFDMFSYKLVSDTEESDTVPVTISINDIETIYYGDLDHYIFEENDIKSLLTTGTFEETTAAINFSFENSERVNYIVIPEEYDVIELKTSNFENLLPNFNFKLITMADPISGINRTYKLGTHSSVLPLDLTINFKIKKNA